MKVSLLLRQYVWLVDIIYRYGPITLAEINERWMRSCLNEGSPLARSTFNRHRQSILDLFGLEIECQKPGYGYYIANIRDLRTSALKKWMLDTISVDCIVSESHQMKSRILLENVPSGQHFITTITRAMQSGKSLVMEHQRFGKEARTVEVEPYCLKLYHQRWYMLGHKVGTEWLIVYALDRIHDMEETDHSFTLPADFDAEKYFNDRFGVIKDDKTPIEQIVLRTTPKLANYYRTLPLHHSQQETTTTDTYSEFTLRLSPTFDFRQEILSQMPDIEVLSPAWLRESIHKTLEEALIKN